MYKIFFFSFISISTLFSQEPVLVKIESVVNNEIQKVGYKQYSFYCVPYGVYTLESIYKKSDAHRFCKQKIKEYYRNNPEDLYFAQEVFHVGMFYHLEVKNKECILYASGETTYGELLLQKGLGVYKPHFKDKELKALYYKAQRGAKKEKRGLWKENIIQNCLGEIYN